MRTIQKSNKYAVILFLSGSHKSSEKQLQLEAEQLALAENLHMYETVWDKVINGRQIELINKNYFDERVMALATSSGDIAGLENFKAYYNNYLIGF